MNIWKRAYQTSMPRVTLRTIGMCSSPNTGASNIGTTPFLRASIVLQRGDIFSKSFSVWWLQQERVVAAFTMNRPNDERDVAPNWIESKQTVAGARLRDASQPISAAAND